MTTIRVLNRTRNTVLGTRVRLANRLCSRMRGFLFRPPPIAGEGILITPCSAVHMFGMRFRLDVIFISEAGRVVAVYPELAPWQWSLLHRSALHALELPAGTIDETETEVGDDLSWTAVQAGADPGALSLNAAGPGPSEASGILVTAPAAELDTPQVRRRA